MGLRVRQSVRQDFGFGFGVRSSEVSTAPAWVWLEQQGPQAVLVTQPVPACKSFPTWPEIGGQCRATRRANTRWTPRLRGRTMKWVSGEVGSTSSVLAWGLGGWVLVKLFKSQGSEAVK